MADPLTRKLKANDAKANHRASRNDHTELMFLFWFALAVFAVVITTCVIVSHISAEARSREIKQFQDWHTQIVEGGGKLAVTGSQTTANGDFVYFNGEVFVPVDEKNTSDDALMHRDPLSRISGVFEARLSRNRGSRGDRMWQPHEYSYYVAMMNGSAYTWKSVFSRFGQEYFVSESCVTGEQMPPDAKEIAKALLIPDISVPVNTSNYVAVESKEDSKGDSSTTDTASGSTEALPSPTWLIDRNFTPGHLSIRLQLVDDAGSFDFSDVSTPSLMLRGRRRAFRKCPSLFGAEHDDDEGRKQANGSSIPLPLRHWVETNFPSSPNEHKRRLNSVAVPSYNENEENGVDNFQFMKSVLANEASATETDEEIDVNANYPPDFELMKAVLVDKADAVGQTPFGPVVNATKCSHGLKKCLFVHGIGVHRDLGLESNFTGYWGNEVMSALPCCSELKFTHFNTVDRPWYSPTLARATCAAALAVAKNSTFQFPTGNETKNSSDQQSRPLSDLVIISHSSGVMNVASMLMHGYCSLDHNSSMWIAIEGPILGSRTANQVVHDCSKPESSWDVTVKLVLSAFDLCPVKKSTASFVRNGTVASGPCLDELYTRTASMFRANVNASLCGVSPEGISSSDSPYYEAMSALSNHEDPESNDGAVSFTSCRGGFPADKYQSTYASAFYKADLNHADGRLVHGDAWSKSKQPIRWLQHLLA